MKKLLFIPLVILVLAGLILVSCGEPAATTTAPPTTSKPPTTSAPPTTSKPPTTSVPPTTTAPPTTAPPTKPAPYGTITNVAASFGAGTFDPNQVGLWGYYIWEPVVRTTEDYHFEGGIVDSWDISADGCTWTFHVHPGNKFTSGNPVTAADLKYSIERFGAPTSRSAWSQYLSNNLASSTVVNDLTYQYVTNHPEVTLLACFNATLVLDSAKIAEVGEEAYFLNPTGSGPWKFVELIANEKLTLEANMNYWRKDEIPYYQYYVELCVPEMATRIAMFRTGDADLLYLDDTARMRQLADEGFAVMSNGINGQDTFCFQGTWFPTAGATGDIRIRKAMSYALDRQEIVDYWYSGFAEPGGYWFVSRGTFGWSNELTVDPYDPVLAKSLIEEAGYPDAFADPVITIVCDTPTQDRILYYMSYWETVGLQVELKVTDTWTYWGYLFHHFMPGSIVETDENVGWIFFWKSFGVANNVYHSANLINPGGMHGTGNDPTAAAMLAEVLNQSDYQTAWDKMAELELYLKTLYINVPVVEYQNLILYNPVSLGTAIGRGAWAGGWEAISFMTHPSS